MKKRLERRSLLLLFLLLIFCVAASIQINEKAKKNRLNLKTGSTEEFRKLGMEEAFFRVLAKTDHEKRGRLYAIYFLENSLFPQDNEKELFEKYCDTLGEMNSISEKEAFSARVRFAMRLAAETLIEK